MKTIALLLLFAVSVPPVRATDTLAADPVQNLSARQRYPWNGLVDISFTLADGAWRYDLTLFATNTTTQAALPVTMVYPRDGAAGDPLRFKPGEVHLVWDAGTDVPDSIIASVSLTVAAAPVAQLVLLPGQLWENGPRWAETNVGAEKPWDCGYYFWWGDTVGYKRENDKWVASDGSSSNFEFYGDPISQQTCGKNNSTLQSEGWLTADGILAPAHDAAQVQWGNGWRMPTDAEFSALIDNCDWTWMTTNGVNGYVVRGRGDYSEASIFLPAAGLGYGTALYVAGSCGYYWSSVPGADGPDNAWGLNFVSHYRRVVYDDRYFGQVVRPVLGVAE